MNQHATGYPLKCASDECSHAPVYAVLNTETQ